MKDLVQCRKLEAKFRQLAVSDPARRFLWLAEAEKKNGNARPKRKSLLTSKHAMPCERPLQSSQSPQNLVHAPEGGACWQIMQFAEKGAAMKAATELLAKH